MSFLTVWLTLLSWKPNLLTGLFLELELLVAAAPVVDLPRHPRIDFALSLGNPLELLLLHLLQVLRYHGCHGVLKHNRIPVLG